MSYRRVTEIDRIRIHDFKSTGVNLSQMAQVLGFHKSTISRELKRNTGRCGYRPHQAQEWAENREASKHAPWKLTTSLKKEIIARLRLKWSPEQISNRLRIEGKFSISTETIYKFIYNDKKQGGCLFENLRRAHRCRRKRFPSRWRKERQINPRSIWDRGILANERRQKGHWERDLMIGKGYKTPVLVFTDRKTRFTKFKLLSSRKAKNITVQSIRLLKGLPIRSITNDRGLEFADHERCAQKLKVKVFFCDPQSPHQRGSNENQIGVIRQYLPKKTDLSLTGLKKMKRIEMEINNRPMKCLDWKTPYEAMMYKLH